MPAITTVATILCIDDDPRLGRTIKRLLVAERFEFIYAATGQEGLNRLEDHPDLILLDITLPDSSGIDLLREIRKTSSIPVIMLTGKSDPIDKVLGLELGADDYITKPFDGRELVARIRTVLRRVQADQSAEASTDANRDSATVAKFEQWSLHLLRQTLEHEDGAKVVLTGREFDLLKVLVLSNGQVLNRDMLMDRIAGLDWNPTDRRIDVLITRVRKKLGDHPPDSRIIKTIRGQGYRFIAKVRLLTDE